MYKMENLESIIYSSNLLAYPILELDNKVYEETGKPPMGKYAKMLTRATPLVDEIWLQCLQFKDKFHDIWFHLKHPTSNRTLYSFIENCVIIELKLQALLKVMDKAKQEKEIQEWYSQFNFLREFNIFNLCMDDLDLLKGQVDMRIDMNELKRYYGEYTKGIKKKIKDRKILL